MISSNRKRFLRKFLLELIGTAESCAVETSCFPVGKGCADPSDVFGWDSFVHEGDRKFFSPHAVEDFAVVEEAHYQLSGISSLGTHRR